MRMVRQGGAILPVVMMLLSCSDPSSPRTPTSLTVISGEAQVGTVTVPLPQPVVVEVRDVDGKPVGGATVEWSIASGGGSVSAETTTTGGTGRTQVQWTLGTTAGQNRLRAEVDGVAPATITAVAQTGPPHSASIVSGNGQTGLEMLPLGGAIVVSVRDHLGNGVPGAVVTFSPSAGVVTPQNETTDNGGLAAVLWTLGPAGTHTMDVSVGGLAGSPLHLSAASLSRDAVTELTNAADVSGIGAAEGEDRYFRITIPPDATHLTVQTTGGPGDADLYIRHARLPTTSSSACESTEPATSESCRIEQPDQGDWYILLDAWSTYSDLTIRATYVVGGSMNVDVTGLPGDAGADIIVTGPDRFEKHITHTGALTSLGPGTYTVRAGFVTAGGAVYMPSPEAQQVDIVAGAAAPVSVAYAASAGALNLDVVTAYITQSVQRFDGSVPLIAGRAGLLRVFARGNAVSTEMPVVRARFYHDGVLASTISIPAPSASLPVSHDEGSLNTTWNAVVPGSLLQPGTTVLVDVDPANEIAEPDEADNSFPQSGSPLTLDVRAAAVLQARLIPVVQSNGLAGDVTAANADTYVTEAQAVYPLPGIDVDVREPYSFSGVLASSYDSTWQRLLREIDALRVAESPGRYYYGVVKPAYTQGGTGLGYLSRRAAVGVDWTNWRAHTVAHEWGHNFGRFHVDCGGPSGTDPGYPYAAGRLGHHGYDVRTNEIRSSGTHYDLMSYCSPTWASDYTYEAVMAFRGTQAGPSSSAGAAEPSLLVWGSIAPDGALLEPSFEIVTAPALPKSKGPYRLTGTNASGATVLDISFDAYEIDHLPGVRTFAYAIPLRMMGGEAPVQLRLRGAGADVSRRRTAAGPAEDVQVVRDGPGSVRFLWDAARTPGLLIRDGRTGGIVSFARGGDARVRTTAGEVEIIMSDGLKSERRRIRVPR